MKFLTVASCTLFLLGCFIATNVVLADEQIQVELAPAVESAENVGGEEKEAAAAVDENFAELVTATVEFGKEPRLIYGKSVNFVVKVQNNASQNVFVMAIVPSYPDRSKITLPPIRNIQVVGGGKSEDIKASFTCELDVKKTEFAVQVHLFNPKDHTNPIKIDAFSGTIPVHRAGNDWFDLQSLGIYAMFVVLGYFSYVWVCSRCPSASFSRGKQPSRESKLREKDVSSQSSLIPDTEWIPKKNLQLASNRMKMASSGSLHQQSTTSLSHSETSDEEKSARKQK